MSRYADQATTLVSGEAVPVVGAKVYVYNQDGSLATLTEDSSGPLANPVTTDAYGNFHFNTADGVYRLEYHYGGQIVLVQEAVEVGVGLPLPDAVLLALSQTSGASLVGTSDGSTVQDSLLPLVTRWGFEYRLSTRSWAGTSTSQPSDNAVVVAGNDYNDTTGLTDNIHTFCTVGLATYSSTVSAGNDYDTRRHYGGTGAWSHHNHFQTGTTFQDSVHFTDVFGISGAITIKNNALVDNYYIVNVIEPTLEDSGRYGRVVGVSYINSHYASDMTDVTSAHINYALEVRKYLLDPVADYAASVMSEGAATFKAISASDSEVGPYNVDGTPSGLLERFNCRVGAGQNGYFKFNSNANVWLVGQPADDTGFRIRSVASPNGGVDIAQSGHITSTAGDNAADLGTSADRWRAAYATQLRPGAGAVIWTSGAGSPEGVVAAPVGSLYTRTDGGTGTTLYKKESGSGNTGWAVTA